MGDAWIDKDMSEPQLDGQWQEDVEPKEYAGIDCVLKLTILLPCRVEGEVGLIDPELVSLMAAHQIWNSLVHLHHGQWGLREAGQMPALDSAPQLHVLGDGQRGHAPADFIITKADLVTKDSGYQLEP